MPRIPILMPQLGESIAEATVLRILFKENDAVEADKNLLEVETNKAVMDVTSPCSGTWTQILAEEGKSYPVGTILGYIEVSDEEARRMGLDEEPSASEKPRKKAPKKPSAPAAPRQVEPTIQGLPVPAHAGGASYLSPRMKARMTELGLHAADMAGIAGSGAGGRVN